MIKWNIKNDTIEIIASEKLTEKDYDEVLPVIDNLLELHDWPKFLIKLDHFEGWEGSAIWKDLRFGLKHRREFGPMAMVGDDITQKWMTQFSDIFIPSDIRYFDVTEEQQAREWLAAQKSESASINPNRTVAGQ